ncbi:MAG: cytochrome c biogenesis protein CcdA [Bacteroidales bacterium]|nr:cytochrome c biogenesis protein CcdA [Bacteroidales bacterium]
MKKFLVFSLLVLSQLVAQAQILEPIKWNIQLKNSAGADFEVVFTASIDDGWHLYNMNLPEGGPISTSFHFEKIQGATLAGKTTANSKAIRKKDDIFKMELSWFEKKAVFIQKIKIADAKNFNLTGHVEYMGCNDESCLPPTPENFEFNSSNISSKSTLVTDNKINTENNNQKKKTESIKEMQETASSKTTVATVPALQVNQLEVPSADSSATEKVVFNALNENPLWKPVIGKLHSFGETGSDNKLSAHTFWWMLFITGFLGGFLALLTPCVWPIIPMTVSFFLKRNKDKKKAIREAILYGLSIIVIYLLSGLGITILFGASALNSLSTNAIFNLLFFALLVLFAISFLGAFELVLPSSWTNKIDKKADSTSGIVSIFFMAFTLVLVSFSCTGPIIGTLLVQAASMNSITGPAIGMFGFAFALAIPFTFFAIFPNMLQNLPKSGGWLNTVKVVLGFLELAFALKFLSVADLAYGWGILDRETFLSIWIVLFALLGLYLLGKIRLPHDSIMEHVSVLRLFMAMASFAFAVYMVPGLWGAPLKSISAFAPPASTQDFNLYKNEVHAAFTDYDAGMEYARKQGKPVMIDFSGYGCVNCRKMENSVWQDSRVKSLLENDYVLITLMVDDKKPLPQNYEVNEFGKIRKIKTVGDKWSYLQRYKFGSNAQPFYLLLNNQGEPLAPSYAYNENVEKYIQFLENGLKGYKQR